MKNGTESDFYSAKPEEIIETLNLYQREAAVVSQDLMVLRQTERCSSVLARGQFYSAEDWLPQSVCARIREAFASGEPDTSEVDIDGMARVLRIVPTHHVALLLFDPIAERIPALILAAVRMRESASNLLETLPDISDSKAAARIRREAMRLLRQATHYEILGGENVLQKSMCDLAEIVENDAQKLRERGFRARAEVQKHLFVPADSMLLESAVMTLASNSIRFGGSNVEIVLKAARMRDHFLLTVADDGVGISTEAVLKQETGWRDPQADIFDENWGMGIPFAERVVRLHGGQLRFLFGQKGCTVCLVLPSSDRGMLEAPTFYESSCIDPADIELSTVLGFEAYLK